MLLNTGKNKQQPYIQTYKTMIENSNAAKENSKCAIFSVSLHNVTYMRKVLAVDFL